MASGDSGGWRMLHFKHLSVGATQSLVHSSERAGGGGGKEQPKTATDFELYGLF